MFGMSKPKPKPATKAQKGAAPPKDAPGEHAEAGPVEVRLALTPAQLQKLDRLGGAAWIARQIDKARSPRESATPGDQ